MLVTDNGPQYSSQEFTAFASNLGFTHITSSPYYPQSNGLAEKTVKTVKGLLKNSKNPHLALLCYRATPLAWCNLSPAELLMGRKHRTDVPIQSSSLNPQWEYLTQFREKRQGEKGKAETGLRSTTPYKTTPRHPRQHRCMKHNWV